MFAPPVAKPQAKTPTRGPIVIHPAGQQAKRLGPPASEAASAVSWDFSAIPIFPSDRAGQTAAPALRRGEPGFGFLQPKLAIGSVDDPLEHEADRIAEHVMRMPAPEIAPAFAPLPISRKCAACEAQEERLRKKPTGVSKTALSEAPASVYEALRAPGQPLDQATRAFFEPRFGRDFSAVRIHADDHAKSAANTIQAHAYTLGRDIAFANGQYAPGTPHGRRLLAHELTHVVQQTGPSPAPLPQTSATEVIRRADAPDPAPAPEPARTADQPLSPGSTTEAEADKPEEGQKDVTVVYDRVDKIVISCGQNLAAFETRRATYIYKLPQCDRTFPPGDYIADVNVEGDNVGLTFQGKESKRLFRGVFAIRKGQAQPSDLLKDQDKVNVTYGGRVSIPPDARAGEECAITFPPQTVFGPGSDTKDLSDLLPKIPTFQWDLANFGLADVRLRLGISASAKAGYSYKEGRLDNICMTPTRKNPLAGRARFSVGGRVDIHFDVTIGAEVAVQALELIDILTAHGELTLDLDAAASGDVTTLVEIEADPRSRQDFRLKTDVELAALAALEANLSGSAGIEFLGFNLWQARIPSILKGGLSYGWTGGLTFDDSFVPTPMLGTLAKASPAQLKAGILRTQTPKRPAKSKESIPIRDVVESWIRDSSGELTADGMSCAKALPLQWYKPKNLYPQKITFGAPGVSPTDVARDNGPVLVSHETAATTKYQSGRPVAGEPIIGPTPIGVVGENWPEGSQWARCFMYIETKGSHDESDNFRQLMRALEARYDGLSPNEATVQIDHVRELQFGGEDSFANLWPFDSRANPSAGSLHQKEIAAYKKILGNVNGRHFKIFAVGLTPVKPPAPAAPPPAPAAPPKSEGP